MPGNGAQSQRVYNNVPARISNRGPSADQLFAAQLQTIQIAENRNRN